MTLAKQKPLTPTKHHKQRRGDHHRQTHHYLKAYWPYLPIALILVIGVVGGNIFGGARTSVLGYATDMSQSSLLDDTNTQRTANGEATMAANNQLTQAAQQKADDMAARDYWSHNTPDGRTPWTFITAAGYTYKTAGENLAYGFDTAADTVTGWMNSPEHRANILNTTYVDVGFGIANSSDYQSNGPETIVVAMYGSTAAATPVAPSLAVAPTASKPVVATAPPQPVAQPSPAPAPAASPLATSAPAAQIPSPSTTQPVITVEPAARPVTRLQLVATTLPISAGVITVLACSCFGLLVIRHGLAWRKVLVRSELFILTHPWFDIGASAIVGLVMVLSRTAGLIQ